MSVVSTNGWDTVYATNYTSINAQIKAQWQALTAKAASLSTINAALSNNKASVSLTMTAWQLAQGGSGGIVRLELPISKGTFNGIDGTYDLAGQTITVQLSLQWVPQPHQTNFAITANFAAVEADLGANTTVTKNIVQAFATGGVTLSPSATVSIKTPKVCWKITDAAAKSSYYLYVTNVGGASNMIEVYQYVVNSLVIDPKSPITPVTVISAGTITDPIDGPVLKELISENIDKNLSEFDFVFASVDVVTQLSADDKWAWLQPTSNEYAVVEPLREPTNDNCVFAILSMVNNRVNPKPVLQVDENAIPASASSSLLISPSMFLTKMLAPGACAVFAGSTMKDFTIDEANLSVTNSSELTWGNFKLDNDDTITLSVAKDDFAMSVQNNRIILSFTNLSYPMTELGIHVGQMNIIFSGQFILTLKEGTNGNKTLWFDVPAAQKPVTNVSAVMNKSYYTIEKVIGGLSIALSVIAIGTAVGAKLAARAAEAAVTEGAEVTATVATEELEEAFEEVLENAASKEEFTAQASADAAATLDGTTTSAKSANIWSSIAKWSGTTAAITGAVAGAMELNQAILQQASQGKWEHTPAFTNFADLAIEQYSFGGLSARLKSVGLADSVQISFVE